MCTNQPGFVGISIRGHKMEGKVGTLGLRKDPSVRVGCSGEQCVGGVSGLIYRAMVSTEPA